MPPSGLLAHLAGRFIPQAENLAIESLAYLLHTYPDASAPFVSFASACAPGLPTGLLFQAQSWLSDDQAIPDLVGFTPSGDQPLVVEAKFWAGLTENQPVTYLHRLPDGKAGLLLFIAPAKRAAHLWGELLRRCRADDPTWAIADTPVGTSARRGEHVLAATNWRDLLAALEVALQNANEHASLEDLHQLAGLCERMDAAAFLPLTSEELTSSTGRRMLQLTQLIDDVTSTLVDEGKASIKGLTRAAAAGWFGRYLRLGGWVGCLLHVNYEHWAQWQTTPLWLHVWDWPQFPGSRLALVDALSPLRHETPPRLYTDGKELSIPLYLPVGADRAEATTALLGQLHGLHIRIAHLAPSDITDAATSTDEGSSV